MLKPRNSFVFTPMLLLVITGCGGSDRPSMAPASGIVSLDGEPVAGASVMFIPSKGGRPGSAITDADGRYTINTFADAPGAIVGDHNVSVTKISGPGAFVQQGDAPAKAPTSDDDDGSTSLSEIPVFDSVDAPKPEIIYEVPQKYMNPNDSGLVITVPAEGSDKLHLELTK